MKGPWRDLFQWYRGHAVHPRYLGRFKPEPNQDLWSFWNPFGSGMPFIRSLMNRKKDLVMLRGDYPILGIEKTVWQAIVQFQDSVPMGPSLVRGTFGLQRFGP